MRELVVCDYYVCNVYHRSLLYRSSKQSLFYRRCLLDSLLYHSCSLSPFTKSLSLVLERLAKSPTKLYPQALPFILHTNLVLSALPVSH